MLIAIKYVPVGSSASPIVFKPLNVPVPVDVLVEYGDPASGVGVVVPVVSEVSEYPVIELPPEIPPFAT